MASSSKLLEKQKLKFSIKEYDVNCVFVGDSGVGKTKLICSYVKNHPKQSVASLINPNRHMPSVYVFDDFSTSKLESHMRFSLGKKKANLRLWDTFGDHSKNRGYSYEHADVVVICFNIGSKSSYENIFNKWYGEIKGCCPNRPIILVGTQMDRRYTNPEVYQKIPQKFKTLHQHLSSKCDSQLVEDAVITSEEGRCMAEKIKSVMYLETSVSTKYGVTALFQNAFKLGILYQLKKLTKLKYNVRDLLQKPYLPTQQESPEVNVPGMGESRMFQVPMQELCDTAFIVSGHFIKCHSIVLAAKCLLFENLFNVICLFQSNSVDNQSFDPETQYLSDKCSNVALPGGFSDITIDKKKSMRYTININDITENYFSSIIELLYSDEVAYCNMSELIYSTHRIQTEHLHSCIKTATSEGVNSNFQAGIPIEFLRKLVANDFLSDCSFVVGDHKIPAHRFILCSNSAYFSAMFKENNFRESLSNQVLHILSYNLINNVNALEHS